MKKLMLFVCAAALAFAAVAQTGYELAHQKWALTPPMGWNSWDCFGPTVVEDEVKANADYMAEHLLDYGWEYVVVDIRWFVENDKAGGYNQTDPIYVYDEYGRYTPALNRFPSAAGGKGFKPLADYCHAKGLKFGIHLMRGCPKVAAEKKLPVKGADGITVDMICNNDSACTWLRDNYKVDCTKKGAQEYYNSCFDMYADWGVDYVKIDDLSRPYHTGEIEMIHKAIAQCGRPMVLSISPGETPIERVDHVVAHANMWRTVDDFWDNWSQLNYQFGICAKWAPYIGPGTWPDADMLPLGRISIRGERGGERWCGFSEDEQYTMMSLWTIFKSPLMFGGHLPYNDRKDNPVNTNAMLTNRDVLYMHSHSADNREVSNYQGLVEWSAVDPANGDRFVAMFNTGGLEFVTTNGVLWRSGTISYLTTGHATDADVAIPEGSTTLALIVTDGGDGFDSDHADWVNPTLHLSDGTTVDLTTVKPLRAQVGWGTAATNKNLNGGSLSIDGKKYDKGLAVHANSVLLYDIPANTVRFTALAGIDNTGSDQGSKSSVEFMVYTYDPTMRDEWTDQWTGGNVQVLVDPSKQAACSGFVGREAGVQQRDIEADIAGAGKLYLVVTNGGDGFSYDHADWANPVLVDSKGNETSLTSLDWDENPINGWYNPKVNRNNEGNKIKIGGVTYNRGIGCNSPSVIVYTLPAGHDYVKFRSIVGFDDDVASAPEGVTMEFRIFTQSPTPDLDRVFPLNLEGLGFARDQKCRIDDMWSGESLGEYANSQYAPTLRSHASGLYRVSAVDRPTASTVSIAAPAGKADSKWCELTVSVSEPEGWVQLLCDDKIVGTLPVADGTARYACTDFPAGRHRFVAKYSGTTAVACSVSDPVEIEFADAGVPAPVYDSALTVTVKGNTLEITSPDARALHIYRLDGVLHTRATLAPGLNTVVLPAGVYLLNGRKYAVAGR